MKTPWAWIAVLAAALVGFVLWRRKGTGDAPALTTKSVAPDLSGLTQVGSNIQQEVTGDIVRSVLDYVDKQQQGCWLPKGGSDGNYVYEHSLTGKVIYVPVQNPQPTNLCTLP